MSHGLIAAGIVLFNPDNKKRLKKCIDSLIAQIEKVYIFDNSTEDINFILPENTIYLTERQNMGIAYALNRIMERAEQDGYQWVVTLDQDSILPQNIISEYSKHILDEKVGIICPQVIDSRRAYMKVKKEPPEEYIETCITSASCTSIEAWKKIGKFDNWLFIDLVDNEFCKRMTVSGYKILRLNTLVLDQEFGNIIPKSTDQQQFWIKVSKLLHNQNFAKFSYKKFVSPMRVYYTNRNIIYVNRKLKKYGSTAYENYNCKGYLGFLISFSLPSLLRAQDKRKVFKAIVKGMHDGRKREVGTWQSQVNISE